MVFSTYSGFWRRVMTATVLAGTLDILAAISLTLYFGHSVADMLRYVASGPFPSAKDWGATGAFLGLVTHFVLMAIMALTFVVAADRYATLKARPIAAGVIYGLITYVIMNLIVVHFRFGTPLPPSELSIVTQLFCHIVLVGIPIALVAAKPASANQG